MLSSDAAIDAAFAALANPTRRAIVARLAGGEATVLELAEPFEMSQPAISRHLKILEEAGLIKRGRDGQRRPCRLQSDPMRAVSSWLQRYANQLEARFERLDELLEELVENN